MTTAKTDTWYPMYPGDYLKDTLDLTLEEDGFYTRALNQVYINKGRIPVEPERLQRLLRVNRVQFNRCKWILAKYFYQVGDNYGNARADIEIAKAQERSRRASDKGVKGNEKRWGEHRSSDRTSDTAAIPVQSPGGRSSSSSSQSSPTGEDPPISPKPKKASRKPNPKTLIADDWQPTAETLAWCAAQRLPEPDYQRPMFINHFKGKGEARADWDSSFRNWMLSPYRKDRNHGHTGNESAAQRNGRRFSEELGKIAAGIGAVGDHEVLPVLPQADAGAGNHGR
jgi:uncharacterized protein YdaU (DUF1376 family)